MEGRKTRYRLLKEIIQYLFIAVIVVLAFLAFIKRTAIENYFSNDLTKYKALNSILKYTTNLIKSIQIIVLAYIICLILKLLKNLSFGLTDKGKTIINMIGSLLRWIVIIISVLVIFYIWGANTKTILASAGILALIIGLGAQSIIADILAGIFIVLEGKYVVGDIVVIDGWRGKIVNIGIRTTELLDISGNIKIINNSEIKSVINQTKHLSVAHCFINVSTDVKLEKIEEVILLSLNDIKNSIPSIKDDIIYKGINSESDITVELLFTAKCYEEDLYQVQRDLHRGLKLLLEKNNIGCFAPPTYVINQEDK